MGHRHIKNLLIATNVNMKGCKAIVFSRGIQNGRACVFGDSHSFRIPLTKLITGEQRCAKFPLC